MVEKISSLADVVLGVLRQKRQLELGELVAEVKAKENSASEKDVCNIINILEDEGLADVQYSMTRIYVTWLGSEGDAAAEQADSTGSLLSLHRVGGAFELRHLPQQSPAPLTPPTEAVHTAREGAQEHTRKHTQGRVHKHGQERVRGHAQEETEAREEGLTAADDFDEIDYEHKDDGNPLFRTSFDVRRYIEDRSLERRELAELQRELDRLTQKVSAGNEGRKVKRTMAGEMAGLELGLGTDPSNAGAAKWAGVSGIGTIGTSPLPGQKAQQPAAKPAVKQDCQKESKEKESKEKDYKEKESEGLKDYDLIHSAKEKLNGGVGMTAGSATTGSAITGLTATGPAKGSTTSSAPASAAFKLGIDEGSGFSKRAFLLIIGGFAVVALLTTMAVGVSPFAVLGSLFSGSDGTGEAPTEGAETAAVLTASQNINDVSSGNGDNGTTAQRLSAEVQLEVSDKGYSPALIEVQKGTELTVTISNKGVYPHAFVLDEFGVSLDVKPGAKGSVTFTANRTGTFAFYSNVSYLDTVLLIPKYDNLTGKLIVSG